MSVHITSWVWAHSKAADSTALNIMLSLADQANDDGFCWPRVKTLAERCRVDERTVYRHLAELEELGELTRHSRPGHSSVFQIHCTTTPDTDVTPDKLSGVTPVSPTPDTGVREGMTLLSDRTVREPSKNQHIRASADAQGRKGRFDDFWEVYPAKKGKPDAKKAWDKAVKKTDPQVIIDGARAYAALVADIPDRSKVKYPQGWLNGERWTDEPDLVSTNGHRPSAGWWEE